VKLDPLATVVSYCRARDYPEPEAEFRFHPSRRWRWDVAWVDERVALEFQGGVWTGGRHVRGKGFTADCEKFATGAALGWRVLPVTPSQVADGSLFAWLDLIFGEPT
jgi:hypothetical protein